MRPVSPRCTGFLIASSFPDGESGHHLPYVRCLNCGFALEPEMEKNRLDPPDSKKIRNHGAVQRRNAVAANR